ncbi:MAG: hypothetical protein CME70_17820 [Halobacteriovorax sp.]|nr:hypothetical protein [Halobacteriovorax sp.]
MARKIIDALGGVSLVAEMIGVTPSAVTHWKNRGLPTNIRTRKRLEKLLVQKVKDADAYIDELWHG